VITPTQAEYTRRWRNLNKDKVAAYNKEYKRRNKERSKADIRKWKKKNAEKIKKYQAEYRAANREKIKSRHKKWIDNKKGKAYEYTKTYRAKKKNMKTMHELQEQKDIRDIIISDRRHMKKYNTLRQPLAAIAASKTGELLRQKNK